MRAEGQGDEAALANFLKAIRAINSDKKEAVIGIQERENEQGEPAVAFQFQRELLYVCGKDVDSLIAEELLYPLPGFEQSVASIFSDADIENVSVHAMNVCWNRVLGIRIVKYTNLAHMQLTLQIIVPVQELLILDDADRFYRLLQLAAVLPYSSRPDDVLLPSASMRQTHDPLTWLVSAASACVPRPLADSGCIPACSRNIARTKSVGFDKADFHINPPYVRTSTLAKLLWYLDCFVIRLPLTLVYLFSCACCNDCCGSEKVEALKVQCCFEPESTHSFHENFDVHNLANATYERHCFFACQSQLFSNKVEGEGAPILGDHRHEGPGERDDYDYGAPDEEPGGPPRQVMEAVEGARR